MKNWYDWIFDASKRDQVSRSITIEQVEALEDEKEEDTIAYHLRKNQ